MYNKRHIPKHVLLDPHYSTRISYPRSSKHKVGWAWLSLATSMLFVMIMASSFVEAKTHNDLPQSGELYFKGKEDTGSLALHLGTHVDAKITGLIANVTYTQRFHNTSDSWQEGIYSFPLPENAAIHRLHMRIGERVIVGEIKEKVEAQRIYDTAKREGKRAALTEQQRANFFTQNVANIGPNEKVEIALSYVHNVGYDSGVFEWRLPTTFTPRYIPGQPLNTNPTEHACENGDCATTTPNNHATGDDWRTNAVTGWALPTDTVPDAHLITPPMAQADQATHTFSLNVELDSGLALTSVDALYHEIRVRKQQDHHRIELKNGSSLMNRDFNLQWRPMATQQPAAAVFSEEIDGETYAMLMLLPPSVDKTTQTLPRDVVFIIDTSGSMQGSSIEQAKNSLQLALQRLQPEDRFTVIEFNSEYSRLHDDLQHADTANINNAVKWVGRLNANGGTEMLPALNAAFDTLKGSEQLQQIIFITDGAVGNEAQLFKSIHSQLNNARLFTVGIGSAPNAYFMRKAAEFGRGSFTYIGSAQDISEKMTALFGKLENAVATDIQINWPNSVEQFPKNIGDIYVGEPIIVTAKLDSRIDKVSVTGKLNNSDWHKTVNLPQASHHSGITKLWARGKITHIEDEGITGTKDEAQVKTAVLRTALQHQLMSRFTSFIAVEETSARPADKKINAAAIPNAVAKGQKQHAVAYPQTATTAEIAWWIGLFFLVSGIVVRRLGDD